MQSHQMLPHTAPGIHLGMDSFHRAWQIQASATVQIGKTWDKA
jgi:hypothetical protein